ncbi:SMP-30/gluconolactonase/LRE family protein [Pseudogemmobacter bohemicus]|uniref:SMP-30/gluconolactonase/LRE family protein n=1 Tax=Pseudogemmobacter bohemicus TaxID=2250708 RepID=UPI001E42AB5C|nr:SMP-30/gluconolactonase/LRE family protein [Pseudogemmobacter bohemicus]
MGEGPGYDPASDTAWWFDIPARKMFLHQMRRDATLCIDLPFAASAMAVTPDGRQLLVAQDGLYFRDPATGALSLHLPLEADDPGTRSNDARVHPSGALWIGTMGWGSEPQAGGWYHYLNGEIRLLWAGVTIPNAVCFSPDGHNAWFTDTPSGKIMQVSTDPQTGLPVGSPRLFVSDLEGPPDGAVTDAIGNVWVALWGAGRVAGFNPDGQRIGQFELPVANVTCPAFVGENATQMLVTTARYGMSEAEISVDPLAGATFIFDLPFRGRIDEKASVPNRP